MFDLTIKRTPQHDGDGYSWGGDTVITVGGLAVNFGKNGQREAEYLYKVWYDAALQNGEIMRLKKRMAEAVAELDHYIPTRDDVPAPIDTADIRRIKQKLEGAYS